MISKGFPNVVTSGQHYNIGEKPSFVRYITFLKENLNASRPSEHPPVRGENVKMFRWDHSLQRQNLSMAFNPHGSNNIGSTVKCRGETHRYAVHFLNKSLCRDTKQNLYLQPMIPPKRFDISPPDWGMLRRSRCVQIFLYKTLRYLYIILLIPVVAFPACDLYTSVDGGTSRSTIGEGGDKTIPSPGRSPKQPLPGIGLHDPLHGRQARPEFN